MGVPPTGEPPLGLPAGVSEESSATFTAEDTAVTASAWREGPLWRSLCDGTCFKKMQAWQRAVRKRTEGSGTPMEGETPSVSPQAACRPRTTGEAGLRGGKRLQSPLQPSAMLLPELEAGCHRGTQSEGRSPKCQSPGQGKRTLRLKEVKERCH